MRRHTSEDDARERFGRQAKYYVTSPTHANPAGLQKLVDLASPHPEWNVLDVGTGPGHVAMAFAPHVRSVIGIDITPEMLVEAEALCKERGISNVEFKVASSLDIPFEDEAFNLVTCRRAAHHFTDIHKSIEEMWRVLVAGGKLVIDDRSIPEDNHVDELINMLDVLHDRSHIREYRPSEWQDMLGQHSFRVEHTEQYIEHRPISSFTDGATDVDAEQIHTMLDMLDDDQRRSINLVEIDGQLRSNHWYIVMVATKE
ncbi:MAG TPA: methyltransferase domain-containing protein [Candidatus Lokiarchaeia archaeon]|nr:methyltransferase domain-containing protein [Candidatus Lokiarchaeia archaeon]